MKLTLNLASRSYLNRRALRFSYFAVIAVLALLLAVNMYGYWHARNRVGLLNGRLADVEQQMLVEKGPVSRALTPREQEQLVTDVEFANEILKKDGFRWTLLLDRLEAVLPERVSIRGIRPNYREGSFNLTGDARTVADLRMFLDNLSGSADFNDVYLLQQARQERKEGAGLIGFSIVVKGAF
ncbi:PilN domain-containing protein [Trichloromonas sp.]|uniref:PilN domain-containing protein n=1 Tax=Trichloromonas sp. TaxID=3069249 RepID=UPI003D817CE5